jgi:hypothetical protein
MRFGKKGLLFGIALSFYCFIEAAPAFSAAVNPSDNPCYSEGVIHRITVEELYEKAKNFEEGDPLFYSLLWVFSDAKRDTCYYADGKDLQKVFLNKGILDMSNSEVRDGKTYYKTRAPVDEIKWASAKISEGNIKVSSRLHTRFVRSIFGRKIIGIPKTLDFTIYTSSVMRNGEGEKKKVEDEYHVFIAYENAEEPFISELFSLLTGLTSHEMPVKKYDKKPNRREAYKALSYLNKRGLINVY